MKTKQELIKQGEALLLHPILNLHRSKQDVQFIRDALEYLKAPHAGGRPKKDKADE